MHSGTQIRESATEQLSPVADFLRSLERGEYELEVARCFCGSLSGGYAATHDRYGIPHPMRLCASCGLIYAAVRLDAPSLARFYEGDYRRIYGDTGTVPFRSSLENERLSDYLRHFDIKPRRALEFGCGNGELLEELADEFGATVFGVELDPAMRQQAVARGVHTANHVVADGYDLVVMHHYLEHAPDLRDALEKAARVIAPGGYLYVSVPGLYFWQRPALWQNAHLWQFTSRTLETIMRACGWEPFATDELICSLWRYSGFQANVAPDPHAVEEQAKFLATGAVPRLSSLGKYPTRVRRENTRVALKRGLPQLEKLEGTESGRCIIVGAGPSAELCPRDPDVPVIVIDRMYAWALDRETPPDYVVAMDSAADVAESFQRFGPFTRHLVAASCDPLVLDALLGRRAFLYQTPQHDIDLHAMLEEAKIERASLVVAGGTVVQAALSCAVALGFREFDLYGVDLHVGAGTYAPGAAANGCEGARVELRVGDRTFTTTPGYFAFAQDFFSWLARARRDGVCQKLRVFGDSLLVAMCTEDIRG